MANMSMKLPLLATLSLLAACQSIVTPTSETEDLVNRIRRDICSRAWLGVTTSRHDVLTEQTKLEIEKDTRARAAYCR